MRSHLPLFALLAFPMLACGAGKVDAGAPAKSRAEMLSKTQVAQKCEEAAKEHDKPFVVEWDATDLASFEAKAARDTVVVRYEGCKMEVLYQCSDAVVAGRFGTYGSPIWTSGTVQALDVKSEAELYAKLPLGAASLKANVERGESLHLKYFVAGVAHTTREALFEGDLRKYPGCAGATHFVWGYNLGAFELGTASKNGAGAEGEVMGYGAGAKSMNEMSTLNNGGRIDSCSTADQRACRVPIRLSLRKISAGDDPNGAMAPTMAGNPSLPPGTPGGPGGPPLSTTRWEDSPAGMAHAAYMDARKKYEDGDGEGCLKSWGRAATLDPKSVDSYWGKRTHAECLMRAGKCDEGIKEYRDVEAAHDEKRLKDDETLDRETRESSNRICPAATAKNDADFIARSYFEMNRIAKTADAKTCESMGRAVEARMSKLDKKVPYEAQAHNWGVSTMEAAAFCIARNKKCADGLPMWAAKYKIQLRGMKDSDKYASESWSTMVKLRDKSKVLTCVE